jgi:hypothetical protein
MDFLFAEGYWAIHRCFSYPRWMQQDAMQIHNFIKLRRSLEVTSPKQLETSYFTGNVQ